MEKKITTDEDLKQLTILGKSGVTEGGLETFPNHHREREYVVTLQTDEFTCVCPVTGQPDFAHLEISYVPDEKILESKSLKLYLQSFRNKGAFHEHVVNVILDEIVRVLSPRRCQIKAKFAVRGGIGITVEAEWKK
ncbi:MAG TPA: preQ(1) synthase [Syntrophales bacterium]|nr:preQ(1) synthase [Syntrophales bacterium]HOL59293.1 preQ(1) synthase [Syntrophales bacterium]HPO35514.1 preQ(1) synthase [Syntrophales bacterium]